METINFDLDEVKISYAFARFGSLYHNDLLKLLEKRRQLIDDYKQKYWVKQQTVIEKVRSLTGTQEDLQQLKAYSDLMSILNKLHTHAVYLTDFVRTRNAKQYEEYFQYYDILAHDAYLASREVNG
jgi:hypothetical protein